MTVNISARQHTGADIRSDIHSAFHLNACTTTALIANNVGVSGDVGSGKATVPHTVQGMA